MPPRAPSINVSQLKALADIVAQPELDRFELHEQIGALECSVDKRLEYLIRHGLLLKTGLREYYHDRYEYEVSDSGIFLIHTWQKDRPITDLIDAFKTAVEMTQGSRESSINVAQLYVLKQVVAGRASTVAELMPLCDHNRISTKARLKNLVNRKLLETDVLFNAGGNGNGTVYSATTLGRTLIETLGC